MCFHILQSSTDACNLWSLQRPKRSHKSHDRVCMEVSAPGSLCFSCIDTEQTHTHTHKQASFLRSYRPWHRMRNIQPRRDGDTNANTIHTTSVCRLSAHAVFVLCCIFLAFRKPTSKRGTDMQRQTGWTQAHSGLGFSGTAPMQSKAANKRNAQ